VLSPTVGLLLVALAVAAKGSAECTTSNEQFFVLGSSYSWDAQPSLLDNNPAWHIFCGKPLYYIFENPYGHCVAPSWPWPEMLEAPAEPYDYITFQPIPDGVSTEQGDIDYISHWLSEQPICTTAIIHPTWPVPGEWESAIHEVGADHTFTNYSVDYYYDLEEKLRANNPGRAFALTRSNEMIDHIFHDPDSPVSFAEMFRDAAGHMSRGPGRYLQHNAFRQAMGQDMGIDVTTPGVDPDVKAYLDAVIALYPSEPISTATPCVNDFDGDLVCDIEDNCLEIANPAQVDSDLDGYGNRCDCDFTNDGFVGAPDFIKLAIRYGMSNAHPAWDENLDTDSDGQIGIVDFNAVSGAFGGAPGPSGLACAGSIPCGP
jgi:hypothetical protein